MKAINILCLLSLLSCALGSSQGFTFKKIFFVLLENQPISVAMKDPNLSALTANGTLLTNLNALINPSQPNYVGLIAGDLMGVYDDNNHDIPGRSLVDLMEEGGVSWKAYQENYPGNCFSDANTNDNLYKRKHNPFMSFDQVRNNQTRCAKIVNSDELYQDIAADTVPQYSFYTPNMNNNGHDTGMAYAGRWLNSFIPPLLSERNFMKDMLVVVTFDEGVKGDNVIYTLLIGDNIPTGNVDDHEYSLYSLLRLVEDQFSLPSLGRGDATANTIDTSRFYQGKYVNVRQIRMIIGLSVGGACLLLLAGIGLLVYKKRNSDMINYKKLCLQEYPSEEKA